MYVCVCVCVCVYSTSALSPLPLRTPTLQMGYNWVTSCLPTDHTVQKRPSTVSKET